MRGLLSVEMVLIGLISVAAAGLLFASVLRLTVDTESKAAQAIIYPEEPPQILSIRCFLDHGYATVETENLVGTIRYRVTHTNGTLVKDAETNANLSTNGRVYFGALMERDERYSVRLYAPDWSVTETCTSRVHDDAVLYYAFDEGTGTSVEDIAGGNTGEVSGAGWTEGKRGSALNFDGSASRVNASDSESLNLTDEITISVWVNESTTWSELKIVAKRAGDYFYFIGSDWGDLFAGIGDGTSYTTDNVESIGTGWQHVAMTFKDSEGIIRLYKNGTSVENKSIAGKIIPFSANFSVGAEIPYPPTWVNFFNGDIDEVRIYDKALSGSAIANIYEAYN